MDDNPEKQRAIPIDIRLFVPGEMTLIDLADKLDTLGIYYEMLMVVKPKEDQKKTIINYEWIEYNCAICGECYRKNTIVTISCAVQHPPGACCHYGEVFMESKEKED